MKVKFPLLYYQRNILLNRKHQGWGVYELPTHHYEHLREEDYEQYLARLRDFLVASPYEGEFLLVPKPFDPEEHLQIRLGNVPPALREALKSSAEGMRQDILQRPYHYRMYLLIRLKPITGDWLEEFKNEVIEAFRQPTALLASFLANDIYQLPGFLWDRIQRDEERAFALLCRFFPAALRVPEEDVRWLVQRTARRGDLREPPSLLPVPDPSPQSDSVHFSPSTAQEGLWDVVLDFSQLGQMGWQTEDREGYCSFLTLSRLPDRMAFPHGTELFYRVQSLDFPVELAVRYTPIHNQVALRSLTNRKKIAKGQQKHQAEAGEEIESDLWETRQENEDLSYYLTKTREPIFKVQYTFTVWGDTEEELRARRKALRDEVQNFRIAIELPRTDQDLLYLSTIPAAPQVGYKYTIRPTAEVLAASMPTATAMIGDPSGFLLGYTNNNKPVFYHPARGPQDPQLSTTASAAFSGALGGGKSMTGNLILYESLLRGARALVFDPKDERSHWPTDLPELAPVTRIVTLHAAKSDRGKLDPLVGAGADEENRFAAGEVAKRLLQFLGRAADGTYEAVAIGRAVDAVLKTPRPSMLGALEELQKNIEAAPQRRDRLQDILEVLRYLSETGQSQLLFGDADTANAIDISQPLTILQVQDLQLPEEGQSDYGRVGIALLMAIADFARRFATQSNNQFKIVFFDESWRLSKVQEGRDVLEELVRTGRSKNSAIYLVSQNGKDLMGEEIRSNLGPRFAFRVRDKSEAMDVCQILGIEATEDNLQLLMSLPPGTCLLSDLEHRVATVHIRVPERLFRVFDTRPGARPEPKPQTAAKVVPIHDAQTQVQV